jgi:subtilisin-like proprotein convertase family protein
MDDALEDGDVAYTIVLDPTSSADTAYNGLDPADVSLVNLDDELAMQTYISTDTPKRILEPHPKRGLRPTISHIEIESSDLIGSLVLDVNIVEVPETALTITLTSEAIDQTEPVQWNGSEWELLYPAAYDGKPLGGVWTLTVIDRLNDIHIGTLQNWSMTIIPQADAASQSSFLGAAFETQTTPEPVGTLSAAVENSRTQNQAEPRAADRMFAEFATDPTAPANFSTEQKGVNEAAFDTALGELESDALNGKLKTALLE